MRLKIILPRSAYHFRIAGVYKITFESGEFYIGGSEHMRQRADAWAGVFENPEKQKPGISIGTAIIERIKQSGNAVFEILELCAPIDVKDKEALYINKNSGDPLMLSQLMGAWMPVLQYKEDGHFIKKHVSISAAARAMNCRIGSIQRVLNGERKSIRGMIFVYEKDHDQRRKAIIKSRIAIGLPKKNKSIKINKCDIGGNVLATYTTYREAAKAAGCGVEGIRRVFANKQKTAGGFFWKYA